MLSRLSTKAARAVLRGPGGIPAARPLQARGWRWSSSAAAPASGGAAPAGGAAPGAGAGEAAARAEAAGATAEAGAGLGAEGIVGPAVDPAAAAAGAAAAEPASFFSRLWPFGGGAETAAADAASAMVEVPVEELSWTTPSHLVVRAIEGLHTGMDLPYYAAIAACVVGVRTVMLPVAITSMKNAAKMQKMKPEQEKIVAKYKTIQDKHPNDPKVTLKYREELMALWKAHGVSPFRSLMFPFLQLPVFVSFFFGMQNLPLFCDVSQEDFLWISDMSAPDPYYGLPFLTAASFYLQAEMSAATMQVSGVSSEGLKWAFRGLSAAMFPITASYPSTVSLYWFLGNVYTLAQTLTLRQPAVRDALGMPPIAAPAQAAPIKLENRDPNLRQTLDKMKAVTKKAVEDARRKGAAGTRAAE